MAEPFEQSWFDALASALATALVSDDEAEMVPAEIAAEHFEPDAPSNGETPGRATDVRRLALGQIVRGAPGGDLCYTMILSSTGRGELVRDSVEDAEVTLVEEFDTALALARGEVDALELLTLGRIKVHGDPKALVNATELLQRVGPALAAAMAG